MLFFVSIVVRNYSGVGMKHVLITGGSSGIGKGLAKLYLQEGASVSLLARREEVLEEAKKELEQYRTKGASISIYKCDVTDEVDVKSTIESAIYEYGRIDVLITSAGFSRPGYFLEQGTSIFKKSFDINVFGTLYAIQTVLPYMEKQGSGKIVMISSGAGLIGIFGSSSYCSAKYAVRGLAEVLRAECKPKGIQVSIAYPPDPDTPMMEVNKDYKPAETKMIMGSGGFFTVKQVTEKIYNAVNKGKFAITIGLSLALLNRLGSLLLPIVNSGFDKKIARFQKSKS